MGRGTLQKMPKYVAFLRAINVGGHIVKMDQLRGLFEAMGLSNVETFIASGNVIFDSKAKSTVALEQKIEKHLHKSLGYPVATFIRAISELATVARYKPFSEVELNGDGNQVYVVFVARSPGPEVERKMKSLASEIDDFHINGREVYWLYRRRAGESKFYGALLEKSLGMQATVRNSNTIRKLAAKYESSESPKARRK